MGYGITLIITGYLILLLCSVNILCTYGYVMFMDLLFKAPHFPSYNIKECDKKCHLIGYVCVYA